MATMWSSAEYSIHCLLNISLIMHSNEFGAAPPPVFLHIFTVLYKKFLNLKNRFRSSSSLFTSLLTAFR